MEYIFLLNIAFWVYYGLINSLKYSVRSAYVTFASKEYVDKALALSGSAFFSRTVKVSNYLPLIVDWFDHCCATACRYCNGKQQLGIHLMIKLINYYSY